jgi:hypothetical protein
LLPLLLLLLLLPHPIILEAIHDIGLEESI